MTPFLLLLIAAPPETTPEPWVGEPPAAEAVVPTRYDQQPGPAAEKPPAGDSFSRRLIALELALSSVVAEQPNLWRFDRLESEAAALLPIASTEADRQAVRDVAARIDRFAQIGARHRSSRDAGLGWRASGVVADSTPTRVAPPVRLTKTKPSSKHDAVGVLRPVVSKRADAPKYAIVGDDGRLAALVTPSPEVAARFDSLLGKRVGLDGKRGFLTDLRRDHVVAERVTPLAPVRR